jgi:hypothetical protein
MVGELLLTVSAFLAHQANGVELFDFALGETDRGQYRLKRVERQGPCGSRRSGLRLRSLA